MSLVDRSLPISYRILPVFKQPQRTYSSIQDAQDNVAQRVSPHAAQVDKADNSNTPELHNGDPAVQVDKSNNSSISQLNNVDQPKLDLGPSVVPASKDEQSPLPADQPHTDSPPSVGGLVLTPSIRLEIEKTGDSHPAKPTNVNSEPAFEGTPNGATLKPTPSKVQDQLRSLPGFPNLRPLSDDRILARSAPSSPKLVPSIPRKSSEDALGFDPLHRRAFFLPTVSQAEQRWTRQKNMNNESNQFLDELMTYEGLEAVNKIC